MLVVLHTYLLMWLDVKGMTNPLQNAEQNGQILYPLTPTKLLWINVREKPRFLFFFWFSSCLAKIILLPFIVATSYMWVCIRLGRENVQIWKKWWDKKKKFVLDLFPPHQIARYVAKIDKPNGRRLFLSWQDNCKILGDDFNKNKKFLPSGKYFASM